MPPTAKEIRAQAWEALREGAYWPFVGALFVLSFITVGFALPLTIGLFIGVLTKTDAICAVSIVLGLVPILYFTVGLVNYSQVRMSLATIRREMRFELFWSGWGHGWKMFWLNMVVAMYVQLWALLLIVPGIVKAFSYAMAPYVFADHPDWTANECITESRRLMDGNKWRFFCLAISFFGWWLLALAANYIAQGFATNFLLPYCNTAFAAFYEDLKAQRGM